MGRVKVRVQDAPPADERQLVRVQEDVFSLEFVGAVLAVRVLSPPDEPLRSGNGGPVLSLLQ